MTIDEIKDEIRLKLTGYVLQMEIDDKQLDSIIAASLRELQRYIRSTTIITIPYQKCIDFNDMEYEGEPVKVSAVARVYRTAMNNSDSTSMDPMAMNQWMLLSGAGNIPNLQSYTLNYLSWNTLNQIRNNTSTDLAFRYDKSKDKLYINTQGDTPLSITIEYIPKFECVEEIKSDYWIDILVRFSVALTKITLGRIRSRYTQSGALWQQDGQIILQEGLNEYKELQEHLKNNAMLCYPID